MQNNPNLKKINPKKRLFILFAVMMVVLGKDLSLRTITHAVSRLWHWR